jgi:hypothetical protein
MSQSRLAGTSVRWPCHLILGVRRSSEAPLLELVKNGFSAFTMTEIRLVKSRQDTGLQSRGGHEQPEAREHMKRLDKSRGFLGSANLLNLCAYNSIHGPESRGRTLTINEKGQAVRGAKHRRTAQNAGNTYPGQS